VSQEYLYTMFVRKKRNKSGVISIQIIDKSTGKYKLLKTIGKYIESGHIKAEGKKYYLTRKGMFISDKITAELFI